jgi:p-hydroxybenzoate 3-monooxygenase
MLGRLLHLEGIDSVIVEDRTREHVIERVRAGVLEQSTVDLMAEAGVGGRLLREGLRHKGISFSFRGGRRRIDLEELTGGRSITVYGQNEVVRDLIAARCASGEPLWFGAGRVSISGFDAGEPLLRFEHSGEEHQVRCDFLAGCDGSRGICRPAASSVRAVERVYPYAWLGILANAPPASDELIYALHERGFALFSMRSPSVTRLYVQCAPGDELAQWPEERIWEELEARLGTLDGWRPNRGAVVQKGVTGMRSLVAEPMRQGRLFLAGDAAHIVPPTGAKGLNLAMADVRDLAQAFGRYYRGGGEDGLDGYSDRRLKRVWRAQQFCWWLTCLLHRSPDATAFDYRRQLAELDYVTTSRAAMKSLAESYAGVAGD